MSSATGLTPVLIRVKRRADEERCVPTKKCKFVATCDSPKDADVYQLLTETKALPQTEDNKIQIKDWEYLRLKKCNKTKDRITCNGQPLDSVENRSEDSLQYIYDIYVVDDKHLEDNDNPNEYREYEDSDEDSNDENYAYNDYPDDNEVSEDVIDYYSYRDDHNDSQHDLRDHFEGHHISSDYELSDEEIDEIERYFRKNQAIDNTSEGEDYEEEY